MAQQSNEPVELPGLYFRARCQSPDCRNLLGGFHIPAERGIVVFGCGKCGRSSVFRNEPYGIRAVLAGPLIGDDAAGAASGRKR